MISLAISFFLVDIPGTRDPQPQHGTCTVHFCGLPFLSRTLALTKVTICGHARWGTYNIGLSSWTLTFLDLRLDQEMEQASEPR